MPAPTTIDEFLELLRKSAVVDEKRLTPFLDRLRAGSGLPSDPKRLARQMIDNGVLTDFQAEQLLMGKWRRFTIGKYKVLERLGAGGMGSVYLCEHKLMRRRVAVKVLPTAKAAEPSSLERFYREARAVASLDHPNIVHAYDIDQDETLHFLVMEYVDGASLQEIIKRSGPMDPVRAAHYIYQSALGLEHAHVSGLVHRDIKPGNLLVDRTGTVKILDMGLARFFNDEEDILTKKYDENVLGTADYLAPEQAVDSHEADTRADIYSLGATFYFLLTGRTPFEEGTIAQKLIWHQTRQPKPVSAYRSDVPGEMLSIIDKMMAKRPEDRYQLPREVAEALARWVQQPIGPPPESEMPRLSLAAAGTGSPETMQSSAATHSGPGSSRKSWQVTGSGPVTRPTSPSPAPRPTPTRPAPTVGRSSPPAPETPQPPATLPEMPARGAVPRPAAAQAPVNTPAAPAAAPHLPSLPARGASNNGVKAAPEPFWAGITDDTGPALAGETLAAEPRPAGPSGRKLGMDASGRFWLIVTISVAVGVVVAAVLLFALLAHLFSRPAGPDRKPLVVSKQQVGDGIYVSVTAAIRAAAPGDVIELADEVIEENVQVTKYMKVSGLTLRAAPGKSVVWTCKPGSEDRPLLQLSWVKSFTVDGSGLTLDGQGKMANLVLLTGECPGLVVKNVQLDGYTSHGIKIMNCVGDERQYVSLQNVRPATSAPGKNVAIFLDANPAVVPVQNDYIDLANALAPGHVAAQQIDRKGPSVTAGHLKLPAGLSW